MKKRKSPVALIFIIAALIGVAIFTSRDIVPAGVIDPELEQLRAENQAAAAPPPAEVPSDDARRSEMADRLGGSTPGGLPSPASRAVDTGVAPKTPADPPPAPPAAQPQQPRIDPNRTGTKWWDEDTQLGGR